MTPKNTLVTFLTLWAIGLLTLTYIRASGPSITPKSTALDITRATIFISIASYRDIQCTNTLLDALSRAKYPERIFIGIVQQNDASDIDCLSAPPDRPNAADILIKYRNNIRIHRVDHQIAKGPTWARHQVIDKLFRGEDYVFQIDSHTRFVPDWDVIIMNNILQLPPKSAISHYPSVWDPEEHGNNLPPNYNNEVARMCKGFYNNENILIPVCGLMKLEERKSVPALIAGAGMSFYPGSVHADILMDPHLPFLFQGEELLFTMRIVAKGYKIYSPMENVVFHYYGRKNAKKFFDLSAVNDKMETIRQWSLQRALYIMGVLQRDELSNPDASLVDIDKYNIQWNDPVVKARMDHYFEIFGIDLKNKKVGDLCVQGDLSKWPEWKSI